MLPHSQQELRAACIVASEYCMCCGVPDGIDQGPYCGGVEKWNVGRDDGHQICSVY